MAASLFGLWLRHSSEPACFEQSNSLNFDQADLPGRIQMHYHHLLSGPIFIQLSLQFDLEPQGSSPMQSNYFYPKIHHLFDQVARYYQLVENPDPREVIRIQRQLIGLRY